MVSNTVCFTFVLMKAVAYILLSLFVFLTVEPTFAVRQVNSAPSMHCTMPCCMKHEQKKAPAKAPMKGMCGDMSCNPFGQYACCTGYIVSNKTVFTFIPEKLWEKAILEPQSYTSSFIGDCWRPPRSIQLV